MSNLSERTKSTANQIVEDYELDHGNYEFFADDSVTYIAFAAPNNTVEIAYFQPSDFNAELSNEDLRKVMLQKMVIVAEMFDAEQHFETTWSRDFVGEKGISTFHYVEMVQDDEEFFKKFAKTARKELFA